FSGTAGVTLRTVEPGLAAALIRVAAIADGDAPCAVVRTPRGWVAATDPVEVVEVSGSSAWSALDGLTPGFWAGFATFELGHAVERVVPGGAAFDTAVPLPDLAFARFGRVEAVDAAPYRARAQLARDLVDRAPRLGSAARLSLNRDEYADRVERVLEFIRAG